MKKRFLAVICCAVLCVSTFFSVSCKGEKDTSESIPDIPVAEKTFEKTGLNIIENNGSEYKIVIPAQKDSVSTFAAAELTEILRLSTGVSLKTVADNEVDYRDGDKYISVGETSMLNKVDITVDSTKLGESGYILKTVGNSLFIASVTASTFNGAIYGVYDMLGYTVNYRAYSSDELAYDKMNVVPLYVFDEVNRPSIDIRDLGYRDISDDPAYAYRMYAIDGGVWNSFAHTMITTYLPYSTYGESHPEWYVGGGQQLCLSNEEMFAEMVERVEARLALLPETTMVMIGREDNSTVCDCDKCSAVAAKYGNCYSGVELEFTNKIAKEVDKWLAQEYPERSVKYYFFAYGPTLNAPVVYNEKTDVYEPYYAETEVYENVGILVAPISMNFAKAPTDSENRAEYVAMKSWSDLFGRRNISIWNYSLSCYSYFFNFNNFGVISEYYRFFRDIGANYVFEQGNYDSAIPTFSAMRLYTQGQLMYNCDLNYDDLVDDFMIHYYGDASVAIKKYYNLIRAHYKYLDEHDYTTGTIFFLLDDKKLWNIGLVRTILGYMDEALVAISPLKTTEPERYETLYNRVQRERLSPLYMLLQYYIDQLADSEKSEYIKDFETYTTMFGIQASRESSFDVSTLIETWKKS